jgi:hypothetical protein
MKSEPRNLLLNPLFEFWDYSTSISISGYSANRWKLTRSGGTPPTVTVSQGTTDNSSDTPLWYRNKSCLQIALSNLGSSDPNTQIRQTIEMGTRFTTSMLALSMIVHGPSDGEFQAGFNNQLRTVLTKGQNSGVDIPTFVRMIQPLNTVASTLSCDIFTNPSQTGTYKIVAAQLEVLDKDLQPSKWLIRDPALERMLLNRFCFPIDAGHQGVSSTTSVFLATKFPVPMRTTPSYTAKLTATNALSSTALTTGTATLSAAGTTTHTATDITPNGARLALTSGWSGLTNGAACMLGTDGIGYFDADF